MNTSIVKVLLRPIRSVRDYFILVWFGIEKDVVIRYKLRPTLGFLFIATVHETSASYILRVQDDQAHLSFEKQVSKSFCMEIVGLFKEVEKLLAYKAMPDTGFRDPIFITLFSSLPEARFAISQSRYSETLTAECDKAMRALKHKFLEMGESSQGHI